MSTEWRVSIRFEQNENSPGTIEPAQMPLSTANYGLSGVLQAWQYLKDAVNGSTKSCLEGYALIEGFERAKKYYRRELLRLHRSRALKSWHIGLNRMRDGAWENLVLEECDDSEMAAA